MLICISAEGEDEEAERILPDDFYYDFDDLISKAFSTEGIPSELLSFQYPLPNLCNSVYSKFMGQKGVWVLSGTRNLIKPWFVSVLFFAITNVLYQIHTPLTLSRPSFLKCRVGWKWKNQLALRASCYFSLLARSSEELAQK